MRRRLLLSYLSLTLFVLLALELPLGLTYANAEHRRVTAALQGDAFALALRAEQPVRRARAGNPGDLARLLRAYRARAGGEVVVVGRAGRVLAAAESTRRRDASAADPALDRPALERPALAAVRPGREVNGRRAVAGDELFVAAPVVSRGEVIGAVRVTHSSAMLDARVRRNWLLLFGLGGVVALVVLLVSVLLARSFTRPLAELDAGAARLGEGDLGTRVTVPADPPELRGLARSFNATAGRLEELVRAQQAFVADASHQLRTPLAALRLRLENLEAEAPDCRADDVEGALVEVVRLSALVDGLLVLARAEHHTAAVVDLEVAPVVAARCAAWTALAEERGVSLRADLAPVSARGTPGRLEQVLDNLVSNAIDAAPAGTEVRIVAAADAEGVRIEVCDAGPGMTVEERARAFDRFWRAGDVRRGRGFGLGLAIVRRLVEADGGAVALDAAPEGGLRATVRLPAARRAVALAGAGTR